MKHFSFLPVFVIAVFGFYSCQDPIDDQINPDLEPVLLADTVFQFVITHNDLTTNSEQSDDFDWENIAVTPVTIKNRLGETVELNLTLPWKTQGNSLNKVDPQISKSAGWELVSVNLGSQESPVERPYFSLYNKEKGSFFLFVHNTLSQSGSFAVGKLELSSDDSELKLVLNSKQTEFNQFDSWFNFEYEVPAEQSGAFLAASDWLLLGTGVQITTINPSR